MVNTSSPTETRRLRLSVGAAEAMANALDDIGSGRGEAKAERRIRKAIGEACASDLVEVEVRLYRSAWVDLVALLAKREPRFALLGIGHREWSPYTGAYRSGDEVARSIGEALRVLRYEPPS